MERRHSSEEEELGRPICDEFVLDAIECAICADIYQHPKLLPTCGHSFCEGCLRVLVKDCHFKQAVPCPMCREPWVLTIDKTEDLDISTKYENLIFACKSSTAQIVCGCAGTAKVGPLAEYYCVECGDEFCKGCAQGHRRQQATRSHSVYQLKDMSVEQLNGFQPRKCSNHWGSIAEFHCEDCITACCPKCVQLYHSHHTVESAAEKSTKMRLEMMTMAKEVEAHSKCHLWYLAEFQYMTEALNDQFKHARMAVDIHRRNLKELVTNCSKECIHKTLEEFRQLGEIDERDHLRALVDEIAEECLMQVSSGFDQLQEHFASRQAEVEQRIEIAEDFCQLVEERFEYEHDIEYWFRQREDVREAEEDYPDADSRPEFPVLKFIKGDPSPKDRISLHYGHIVVDLLEFPKQYLNMPEIVNSLQINSDKEFGGVTGMTIMHERLYIAFSNSTQLQIRSLTAAGEGDLECIDIPDGDQFRDLASIQSDKPTSPDIVCIAESTMLIVLSILDGEVTDRLDIDLEETGNISTSKKDGYVVMSLPLNQKVLSMNCATGDFVWCLKLDQEAAKLGAKNGSSCMSPLFTIQVAPGRFLVSDSTISTICILGLHGEIIHLYNGLNGTGPGALQRPQHMVVDGQMNVLLLETRNDPRDWQVLLLSPSLQFLGVLVRARESDTREPTKICLDSMNGRLYIGMRDGRVFSYKVIKPSTNQKH